MKCVTFVLKAVGVIAGLILLVYLLVPTGHVGGGDPWVMKCETRIGELNDGCMQYFQDWRSYPGQAMAPTIGSGEGQVSGAQVLARAMFTKRDVKGAVLERRVSNYATYMDGDLIDADGRTGLVSDRYPGNPMPILYYPSRSNAHGMAQFLEADNAVHSDAHRGDWGFYRSIRDEQYGTDTPRKTGKFLLIGAGADRKYFSGDDQHNWK